MKLKNIHFLIFIVYFSMILPANAAYWGFSYREFGAENSSGSSRLYGGKTYTALENGIGAGVGGYLTIDPIQIDTDYYWIEDEAYLQFAGIYLLKKIYYGGFFDLTVIPNLFYGRGNMYVNRINIYSDSTILEDNSQFIIIEPGISLEFSITSNIKIESSFSISSLSGTSLENYGDSDFGGYTVSFSIVAGSSPFDYAHSGRRSEIGSLFPGSSAVESSRHKE